MRIGVTGARNAGDLKKRPVSPLAVHKPLSSLFRLLMGNDRSEEGDVAVRMVASFKYFSLPVSLPVRLPVLLPILGPTQSHSIALAEAELLTFSMRSSHSVVLSRI